MAKRLVVKTRKGYAGDILALSNPDESWSPRYKNDAIKDIENGVHNYFIEVDGKKISIEVLIVKGSRYLSTDIKNLSNNILGNLSNC
jgi:hypothetical protein